MKQTSDRERMESPKKERIRTFHHHHQRMPMPTRTPTRPRQALQTPTQNYSSHSSHSPPPVLRNANVEVLDMPDLHYSPHGQSIYEKNPHPLAQKRSIVVKNHNIINEETSHETSTVGSNEGSEDLLISPTLRRRRSSSFDNTIPIPRIKLRPRYAGMTGISSSDFRSQIANGIFGQESEEGTSPKAGRRKVEPTHMRAHTFGGFDSTAIFDDIGPPDTEDVVDFGDKGVWGSTSTPLTPEVKTQSTNSETMKEPGLLHKSDHMVGSAILSSNNSAFEPRPLKNPYTKSSSDESSSSHFSEKLTGFRFLEENEKHQDDDMTKEDVHMTSLMEEMDVTIPRKSPNTIPMAAARPRSTSPATNECTTNSNRHRRSS